MIAAQPRWYVAQTQPNSENKALVHLARPGFTTYLPRFLKRRRHARRIDVVAAPLFPRYLFIAMDMSTQRWRSVFSTVGVSRVVCTGDTPTPVADQVVAMLKNREDASGFIQLDQRPRFNIGDQVRVLEGVFNTSIGIYDGMPERDRIAILLDLLGRKVRVILHSEAVATA